MTKEERARRYDMIEKLADAGLLDLRSRNADLDPVDLAMVVGNMMLFVADDLVPDATLNDAEKAARFFADVAAGKVHLY